MKSSIIGRRWLWMRWLVLLIIIMLFLGGCIGASPDTVKTAAPTVSPPKNVSTLTPGVNGTIESMTLITSTVNSEYYGELRVLCPYLLERRITCEWFLWPPEG